MADIFKIGALKNFANHTGKKPALESEKETATLVPKPPRTSLFTEHFQ